MTIRLPLPHGCVALLVLDVDDRSAYSPRPLAREEHDAARCGCDACVWTRELLGPAPAGTVA